MLRFVNFNQLQKIVDSTKHMLKFECLSLIESRGSLYKAAKVSWAWILLVICLFWDGFLIAFVSI